MSPLTPALSRWEREKGTRVRVRSETYLPLCALPGGRHQGVHSAVRYVTAGDVVGGGLTCVDVAYGGNAR
jgi:hypothetical protein